MKMKSRKLFISKANWDYYERHCKGKIKHSTTRQAEMHIRGLNRVHPLERYKMYACNFCQHIHVGHQKPLSSTVERLPYKEKVGGSNPSGATTL